MATVVARINGRQFFNASFLANVRRSALTIGRRTERITARISTAAACFEIMK